MTFPDAGMAPAAGSGSAAFAACTIAIAKAIIGAGMVALPRAFLSLGAALGTAMLALVAALVLHGMRALVDGTARYSAAAGQRAGSSSAVHTQGTRGIATYRDLARAACGARAGLLTQLSVILFCFGFCVVNLVVLADIVMGSPPAACNGLACLLTGAAGGLLEDRAAVLLAVAGGAAAPLLLLRSMQRLTFLNWAGIGAALGLALLAAGLGASAAARGAAHALPWLPPHFAPGGGGGGGGGDGSSSGGPGVVAAAAGLALSSAAAPGRHPAVAMVVDAAAVLAVVLTSYVAHQAVHPAMPLMRPYSPARMRAACAAALALAFAAYLAFSLGACLAFGPALGANALTAFSADAMAPLLGGARAARCAAVALLGAYFLTILSSFVLFVHPLRTSVAELIWDAGWGGGTGGGGGGGSGAAAAAAAGGGQAGAGGGGGGGVAAAHEARHYLALTYGILAAATAAAIAVPDIWQALSVIGNGAASVEAFVVPGLLGLAMLRQPARARRRAAGAAALGEPLLGVEGVAAAAAAAAAEEGAARPAAPLPAFAAAEAGAQRAGGPSGGEGSPGGAPSPLPAPPGSAVGWGPCLARARDAGLAWLLLLLGCGLLLNGAAQQLLAAGLLG